MAAPAHDQSWFEALFREHSPAIVRFLWRRGAGEEAEDLASEVFVTAWRKRDDIPDDVPLAWLYKTAGLTLSNWYRKKKAAPMGENQDFLESQSAIDPAVSAVEDDQMRRALQELSERDREVLILHAWDGLDGDALAEYLGISRGGADAALSRARSRLEAALEKAGE